MRYTLLATFGALALVAACSTLTGSDAPRAPSAAQCPVFATYSPSALQRAGDPALNAAVASYDEGARSLLAEVPFPAEAANAATRIRVSVPPSGMWALYNAATAWKDEAGVWWIARRTIDYRQPPPPRVFLPPGHVQPPPPTMEERFPLIVGPASAASAARLEAYLADPCMNAEPTRQPGELPRRRGAPWICALDSSLMVGEIIEPNGRTRIITVACENELVTTAFLRFLYGGVEIEPGREERRTRW